MQPTLRHVPPNAGRLSMHATDIPSCAARKAATYPPGPPPITIKSNMVLPKKVHHKEHKGHKGTTIVVFFVLFVLFVVNQLFKSPITFAPGSPRTLSLAPGTAPLRGR